MSEELPEVPDELRELFDAERSPRGPDEAARARLRSRLMPIMPGGAGGGPSPSGGGGSGPSPAGASSGSLAIGLALLLGLAAGAGLHAWLVEPEIEIRTVEVLVPAPPVEVEVAEVTEPPDVAPEALEPALDVPEREPTPAHARVDAGSRDLGLAEENALIERAQTALGRGQPAQALEALREHARIYPRGQLVEEREALWVQSLARSGDVTGARERAERFRRRFPSSMLAPAVEASLP